MTRPHHTGPAESDIRCPPHRSLATPPIMHSEHHCPSMFRYDHEDAATRRTAAGSSSRDDRSRMRTIGAHTPAAFIVGSIMWDETRT